jgi:hypothetical protein
MDNSDNRLLIVIDSTLEKSTFALFGGVKKVTGFVADESMPFSRVMG